MNKPIFTLSTGTPTARAASASPPAANIQFPTLVRSNSHMAIRVRTIHQTTVILMLKPKTWKFDANMARSVSKPPISEMFLVAKAVTGEVATKNISEYGAERIEAAHFRDVLSCYLTGDGLCDTEVGTTQHKEHAQSY